MRIMPRAPCVLLIWTGFTTAAFATDPIDRSKYIEVLPGEKIVLSFRRMPVAPISPEHLHGLDVAVEMDTPFRDVAFPGLSTNRNAHALKADEFNRMEPFFPKVTTEFYENATDSKPAFSTPTAIDGALGLRVTTYDPIWKDFEGAMVVVPDDTAVRVYGFCVSRNVDGTIYSTGDLRYSPDGWILPDGTVESPIQVQKAAAPPPIPVGRVIGLRSDTASPARPVVFTQFFSTVPDKRYQLQSTRDLRSPAWVPHGNLLRAGAVVTPVRISLDRNTLFCRLVEYGH